ncbi:MAG TPA: hypothetical protein VM261_27495 [Kofleriaceae bacterium]|nr:hypothetical protein [Kofleriaceae bacterium]
MTRIGRLAGALLVEASGAWYLVGHLKQPCDFAASGFAAPVDLDARAPTGLRLEAIAPVTMAAPWLELDVDGDAVIPLCARRLVIERTGLVSERLWRLLTETGDHHRWFGEMPDAVWDVVRDALLRCS